MGHLGRKPLVAPAILGGGDGALPVPLVPQRRAESSGAASAEAAWGLAAAPASCHQTWGKLPHTYSKRFNAKYRSATHRPDKKDFNTSARNNNKLHCLLFPAVGKRGCHSGRQKSPLGAELCTEGRKTPGLLQRVVLLTDPHRLSTEQRILTTPVPAAVAAKGTGRCPNGTALG